MTGIVIAFAVGALLGVLVAFAAQTTESEIADWKLRTAKKVREQADYYLSLALSAQIRADALTTPTAAYRIVKPGIRKRLGQLARERFQNTDVPPNWTVEELRSAFSTPDAPNPLQLAEIIARSPRNRSLWADTSRAVI